MRIRRRTARWLALAVVASGLAVIASAGAAGAVQPNAARPVTQETPYPPLVRRVAIWIDGVLRAECTLTGTNLVCTASLGTLALGSHTLLVTGFDPNEAVLEEMFWIGEAAGPPGARRPGRAEPVAAKLAGAVLPGPLRAPAPAAVPAVLPAQIPEEEAHTHVSDEQGRVNTEFTATRVGREEVLLEELKNHETVKIFFTTVRALPTTGDRWQRIAWLVGLGGLAIILGAGLVWITRRRRRNRATPAAG